MSLGKASDLNEDRMCSKTVKIWTKCQTEKSQKMDEKTGKIKKSRIHSKHRKQPKIGEKSDEN